VGIVSGLCQTCADEIHTFQPPIVSEPEGMSRVYCMPLYQLLPGRRSLQEQVDKNNSFNSKFEITVQNPVAGLKSCS